MKEILKLTPVFLALVMTLQVTCQPSKESIAKLYDQHNTYKANFITHRRFKHNQIQKFIGELGLPFRTQVVGKSNEARELNLVSAGKGETSVLLWSQMHGNEPTATMALMDIFNFFQAKNDGFDEFRTTILENTTMHFIPMLNPDGAERFIRRNTQGIDINRDALRLQTPEGRTLKKMRDSLDADWGFNLHDQGRSTYVEKKPATISMLAPAYNFEKSINEKRGDAMKLIALMNNTLQSHIPDQVSRYWDDFEPRAFGDNIQKWGTRTILIESGGMYRDREKQYIRQLNFMILLQSLHAIATGEFKEFSVEDYEAIPSTNRGFRDVIIKNVQLPQSLGGYLTDVALNFVEQENETADSYTLRASIADIGDLSTSGSYQEYDVEDLTVMEGKSYPGVISGMDELMEMELSGLLKEGFTDFVVKNAQSPATEIPVRIHGNRRSGHNAIQLGGNPSLLFYQGSELKYVLINGYLFSADLTWKEILEGMNDR